MARREATFGGDLAASLSAWSTAPALPLLTVAVAGVAELSYVVGPAGGLIALPALVVLAGFAGTQRIWYLRVFRGRTLERDLIWPMTWAFVGRYIALAFLVAIPLGLFVLALVPAVHGTGARALVTVPFVFVADFVGTFVTSALAFSTRRVSKAIAIGWRTLWDGWPATAPYALVAPLVIIGLGQTLGRTTGGAGPLVGLLGTMLALLCKGATTAYYARVHRVGDYGAAVPE